MLSKFIAKRIRDLHITRKRKEGRLYNFSKFGERRTGINSKKLQNRFKVLQEPLYEEYFLKLCWGIA